MKKKYLIILTIFISYCFLFLDGRTSQPQASEQEMSKKSEIIFLHHSTGNNILKGDVGKLNYKLFKKGALLKWLTAYNKKNGTTYQFNERFFPKKEPYGWNNYPYDYYNIWVKNAGNKQYKQEDPLELLSKKFDTIMWKQCFPVSRIKQDTGSPDIDSKTRTLENYKLQYSALKEKMQEFPDTTFIVWTGAALVEKATSEDQAKRMGQFVDWVKHEWDEKGDNIFLWDFYELQTEGDLYFKDKYAKNPKDSHPNKSFSQTVVPYLGQRMVNILEGRGDSTSLTGKE